MQVLTFLFPGHMDRKPCQDLGWIFGSVCKELKNTDVTKLCLLNGCLAMLDVNDLTTEYKLHHLFITEVLGRELLEISQR